MDLTKHIRERYEDEPIKRSETPEGFVLVIDTSEQLPFFLESRYGAMKPDYRDISFVKDSLEHGDYSVKGFEDKLAVERKMTSDFFSYAGKERSQTECKLEAMNALRWKALVVEAALDDLLSPHQFFTLLRPQQVWGFLKSLQVKYGLHLFCHRRREVCELWTLDYLMYGYEKLRSGEL